MCESVIFTGAIGRTGVGRRPQLLPGTRVVSHFHDMDDWTPAKVERLRAGGVWRNLYLWVIPPR